MNFEGQTLKVEKSANQALWPKLNHKTWQKAKTGKYTIVFPFGANFERGQMANSDDGRGGRRPQDPQRADKRDNVVAIQKKCKLGPLVFSGSVP